MYVVYRDEAGFQEHQRTPHYLTWKEQVASMMAVPRAREPYTSVFPEPWE